MKAHLSDEVIAEARDDEIVWVDGIPYFPPGTVTDGALERSEQASSRLWRGLVHYHEVLAAGTRVDAGAWSYSRPLPTAVSVAGADFSGYVAYALTEIDVRSGPDGDMGRDGTGTGKRRAAWPFPSQVSRPARQSPARQIASHHFQPGAMSSSVLPHATPVADEATAVHRRPPPPGG